jgi:hypothetical protein
MMLLAASDPVVLAGVFKTLGWVVLALVVLAGLVVGVALGGVKKLITLPGRVLRRRGKRAGE